MKVEIYRENSQVVVEAQLSIAQLLDPHIWSGEYSLADGYNKAMSEICDKGFRQRVMQLAELALKGGYPSLPAREQPIADALGDGNYFGVREWANMFWTHFEPEDVPGFQYPIELLETTCPFDPKAKIGTSHTVFLGKRGMTLPHLKKTSRMRFDGGPQSQIQEEVNASQCQQKWYLVLSEPISYASRSIQEVENLLPADYRISSTCEVIMRGLVEYYSTGQLDIPAGYTRTQPDNGRVSHIRTYNDRCFEMYDGPSPDLPCDEITVWVTRI